MGEDRIDIRQPPYASIVLHPPADEPAAPMVGKTVRTGPGAGGVKTAPQAAQVERKIPIAGSEDAAGAAQRAETACDALEDARINFAKIDLLTAPPDEIAHGESRLYTAQKAADDAVEQNVKAQTALNAEKNLTYTLLDNQGSELSNKVGPHPDPKSPDLAKLATVQGERYLALVEKIQSDRSLAMALSLRDIAKGVRPGRNELAKDIRLQDAQSATVKLNHAYEQLSKVKRPNIEQVKRHVEQIQKAASANRAEWATLHSKAIKSGDLGLVEKSKKGLESAEQELEFVSSSRFVATQGL
jgi:hypothetical protein